MNLEIANKLQKLRKDRGLSQEELADKLGISRQAVSKWERAESSPDTDNLIALAGIYGISLDELLLIKNEETEEIEKEDKNVRINLGFNLEGITGLVTILLLALYLVGGFVWGIWHPTWVGFLIIPFIDSLITAIKKKSILEFDFILIVVAVYLFIGFEYKLWHPGWLVFLALIIYDCIVDIFVKRKSE